jgi:hypothetical protein
MTTSVTRNRGFSVVRTGLYVGVLGLILILLGVLAFFADQSSRRTPFEIPPFPGAEVYGTPLQQSQFQRSVFYLVENATPEQVAVYYEERMRQHYGDSVESCVRIPPTGENPVPPGSSNVVPYQYRCLFDNSGFRVSQSTLVLIYPGYFNPDPYFNTLGKTVIEYQQSWQG